MIPCFSGLSATLRGYMCSFLMHQIFKRILSSVLKSDPNVVSQKTDLFAEQTVLNLNKLQRSGNHGKRNTSYVHVPFAQWSIVSALQIAQRLRRKAK